MAPIARETPLNLTGLIIWCEGLIGAGKTTLAKQLSELLDLRIMFEPVKENPYLDRFYENPKRWAFAMQMHLLHYRFALQNSAMWEAMLGRGAIIDRGLPGDRVFAKLHLKAGNIDPLEWETYEKAYAVMSCELRPPSVIVYLDVSPEEALSRIQNRGRDAEMGITVDYLRELHEGYTELLNEIEAGTHAWSQGMRVIRIPWNESPPPAEVVQILETKLNLAGGMRPSES